MSVLRSDLRVFRTGGAVLGEGPFWDPQGELVWVSISERRVIRSPLDGAPGGSDDAVFETPLPVGFVVPALDGRLALGLADGVYLCDADGGALEPLAVIEHAADGIRLNDGAVDPQGRLVAGSYAPSSQEALAALYLVDIAGEVRTLRDGFGNANGVGWSPDGSLFYFTDTRRDAIFVTEWGIEVDLDGARVFHEGVHHDGLTVDAEGCVWGAVYGAGEVLRMSPSGEVLETVSVPTPNTTSVALGGAGLSTLFITTAAQGTEGDELAGAVFAIDVAVEGIPAAVFGSGSPLAPSA